MSEKTKAQFLFSSLFFAQEHNYTRRGCQFRAADFSPAITRMSIPALTCDRDDSSFSHDEAHLIPLDFRGVAVKSTNEADGSAVESAGVYEN